MIKLTNNFIAYFDNFAEYKHKFKKLYVYDFKIIFLFLKLMLYGLGLYFWTVYKIRKRFSQHIDIGFLSFLIKELAITCLLISRT